MFKRNTISLAIVLAVSSILVLLLGAWTMGKPTTKIESTAQADQNGTPSGLQAHLQAQISSTSSTMESMSADDGGMGQMMKNHAGTVDSSTSMTGTMCMGDMGMDHMMQMMWMMHHMMQMMEPDMGSMGGTMPMTGTMSMEDKDSMMTMMGMMMQMMEPDMESMDGTMPMTNTMPMTGTMSMMESMPMGSMDDMSMMRTMGRMMQMMGRMLEMMGGNMGPMDSVSDSNNMHDSP